MEKIKVLKKTELFGSLKHAELISLSKVCIEHHLKKGQILFRAGEDSKGLYVIAKGTLRAFRQNLEGREQVIHVEMAGTTIAELPVFDDQPYPSTVVAEENSDVFFISKQDVKSLCLKHPTIALAALKLLASRLRKTAGLVESLSLKEVDQRLATFLLQEFKNRKMKKFKLPSHSKIAARLGSVREVVSRAFTKLEAEGWVCLDAHHNAEILNEAGLRQFAGK